MKGIRRWVHRLRALTTTTRDEERLRQEIEDHLARQTEEFRQAGLSYEEARREAVLKFGAVEAIKEKYRDDKGIPFLETLVQDLRYAVRRLRRAPVFAGTTVLTLALGIGATTSIFSLVHAVLLKSLAVANPTELYRLGKQTHCCVWGGYNQGAEFSIVSYDLYRQFRDHTIGFAELAGFQAGSSELFGVRRARQSEPAQTIPGKFVSGNYFLMFGLQAFAGRTLLPSDDKPNAEPVAVMSYRLWSQKYGANPAILGMGFDFDGKPFTVVGIAPPGFYGDTLSANPPDFYLPLNTEPLVHGETSLLHKADAHWLHLIGRIHPGVSVSSIEAQMRVQLHAWLRSTYWGDMDPDARALLSRQTLYLQPGGAGITAMREQYEHWLQILMMVSGFVLLIVCANVANLMLVRGLDEQQQISLRAALGSRVSRLVRQALTETILLSLLGGAAGLALAFAGTRMILLLAFPVVPGQASVAISASPSLAVLGFAFAVSVATGIGFGLAPALIRAKADPIEALRGATRSTPRSSSHLRKLLVVLQAALALVLLTESGLLTTTLRNLETQDFGFEQDGRTVLSIDPQLAGYRVDQVAVLYRRVRESIGRVPGVEGVTACAYSPQSGDSWTDGVYVDGRRPPGLNESNVASFARVTGGFFDVLGNRIVQGRPIVDSDTENAEHVAVVNEAFVRRFFPHENPVGKYFGRSEIGAARQYRIVGVAKDIRYLTYNLDKPIPPFFFLPESQKDVFPTARFNQGDVRTHFLQDVVVRTKAGVMLSDAQLRQAVAAVDPSLPVTNIRALRTQVSLQFSQQRLLARLTSFFGVLALILASIGLYGVTAYNAERRTSEIGLRMALGANRKNVVSLVLQGAFGLVFAGLVLGLPLTAVAGRFLGAELYGMSPYSPAVTAIAVISLGVCALIAAFIPAVQASSISPMQALRSE